MINQIGQVMLYVNDQEKAVEFWVQKIGFHMIAEENQHGMKWIEIAPTKDAQTSIVLHDKEVIAKMSPELNLGTPSLMFMTEDLEELYDRLVNQNVQVGEMIDMPSGRSFNFADSEENYFAVMEK